MIKCICGKIIRVIRINTENDFNTSKKIILETDNFFALNNTSKLQSNYNKLYDKH